ncbi:uncharacterized protein LOC126311199 [Schistocerca gregaria]|uniref:uncharacterized protein LOC126311199 n=1 Tax=Schistocerca gregaria TaxID=7010 RepID=UPI00211DA536|nr:uncharacterized protein LOC126311199 [Schistocerca gregaria]XP_049848106.1 uncharacterized protein LOC126311199 [Schistocerca gregaria]XP_049848107.1 uncharacterized protein LOC126311199 [Schistocerca gregaria]XP_049848108.1 uncharacterized protein LOC126311199 [Schistocerca gregaria]
MESTGIPDSNDARSSFFSTETTHTNHTRQSKYLGQNDVFSDDSFLRSSKNSSLHRALNDFMKSSHSYVEYLASHGTGKSQLLTFLLNALQKKESLTATCNLDVRSTPSEATDRDILSALVIREELNNLQSRGLKLFEAVQELTQRLNDARSSRFDVTDSVVSYEEDALAKLLLPSALPENMKKRQAFDERKAHRDRFQSSSSALNQQSPFWLEQGHKKLRIEPLFSCKTATLSDQIEKSPSFTKKGSSSTEDRRSVVSGDGDCSHPCDGDRIVELGKAIEYCSPVQGNNHDELTDSVDSQSSCVFSKTEWSSQNGDDFKSDSSCAASDIDEGIYHEKNLYLYNDEDEESEVTENFVSGKDQTEFNDSSSDEEMGDTASTDLFLADPSDTASIRIILPTCLRLPNSPNDENCNQDLPSNMRKRGFDGSADSSPESGSTKRFFI